MYPRDAKHKEGRLRLMDEANPMAFIVELAGRAATDGKTRILDIQPAALHQRVGVSIGSKNEVERVTSYHAQGWRWCSLRCSSCCSPCCFPDCRP